MKFCCMVTATHAQDTDGNSRLLCMTYREFLRNYVTRSAITWHNGASLNFQYKPLIAVDNIFT